MFTPRALRFASLMLCAAVTLSLSKKSSSSSPSSSKEIE
jgi:hypothetical protein